MAKAVVTVSVKHLDTLTKQLEEYRKTRINELMKQWLDAFCSKIVGYARDGYEGAVNVDYYETAPDHGGDCAFIVTANGDAVVFLEFGAGFGTDPSHEYAGALQSQTGIEVDPGSYSRTVGVRMFEEHKFWYFNGLMMNAVRPRRALLHAVQLAIEDMGKKE